MASQKLISDVFTENLNTLMGTSYGANAALARHCGVCRSQVGKWRSGRNIPSLNAIGQIADFLGVSINRLLTSRVKPAA